MNFKQLSSNFHIQPALAEILDRVREISRKDIDFRVAARLATYASTKIARERMESHIIYFREDVVDRLSYIIAHECGHIVRMMEAPASKRVVPGTSIRQRAETLKALELTADNYPVQLINMWTDGLVMQLTNLPVDIRIERWLNREYPKLREEQHKGLSIDAEKTLAGLSDEIRRVTPSKIFQISNAMTYAYLRGIGEITREHYGRPFYGYRAILATGRTLYETVDGERDDLEGDVGIINKWAETLGLDSSFSWIDFEDMPESYFDDV